MGRKNIDIRSVIISKCETIKELESGWMFLNRQLNGTPRDVKFYEIVYRNHPELLIVAKYEEKVCGAVFSHINDKMELHIGEIAVSPDFHHLGIGSRMLKIIEKNAIRYNLNRLILGGKKEVASFYQSNGFTPNLFIQNEVPPNMDKILEIKPNVPILEKFVSQGWNQLILKTNGIRTDLENLYRSQIPNSVITYVYDKKIQ